MDPDGQDSGSSIDPNGFVGSYGDSGSSMDPNGVDRGPGMDPEGQDTGSSIDPNG
jgi:hypothetical protein